MRMRVLNIIVVGWFVSTQQLYLQSQFMILIFIKKNPQQQQQKYLLHYRGQT